MFKKTILVLVLAGLPATSTWASGDNDALWQEIRRLAERVEQLEAANKKLVAAAQPQVIARLEDVENEVLAIRKQPKPFKSLDGVSVGASLLMVVQGAHGVDTELTSRADIEVELPMGTIGDAEGKLFAHFRAGDGEGIEGAVGAFAPINATTFGNTPQPVLMQAWYQLDMPVGKASGGLGRLEFTLGKIDPFGFFDGNNVTDDESEQFLNLAFIHNPLLDAGGDTTPGDHGASPGLLIGYMSDVNGANTFSTTLGVFGAGAGSNYVDSFNKPLLIGQVEYAGKTFGGLAAAYRLYAWNNGSAYDMPSGGTTLERHSGWGVSLDQKVAANVTLSSRLGFSTKGNVNFDRAYTLGAQFGGAAWSRENDRIGLGYGWLNSSKESGLADDESMVELYYAWQINDNLALTPDIQWIRKPAGNGARVNLFNKKSA